MAIKSPTQRPRESKQHYNFSAQDFIITTVISPTLLYYVMYVSVCLANTSLLVRDFDIVISVCPTVLLSVGSSAYAKFTYLNI